MFGIKIISEKEYVKMQELVESNNVTRNQLSIMRNERDFIDNQLKNLQYEYDHLKDRFKKLESEANHLRAFKRDTLEALANIDLGSFRIQVCESKCDTCDKEPTDCHKYTFGSHSFCVIPKQQPSKE